MVEVGDSKNTDTDTILLSVPTLTSHPTHTHPASHTSETDPTDTEQVELRDPVEHTALTLEPPSDANAEVDAIAPCLVCLLDS